MELDFTQPIRCYDGAFDSASQRVIDAQKLALEKIRQHYPKAIVTYHPAEEFFVVHEWGLALSAECSTRGSALRNAMERLGIAL